MKIEITRQRIDDCIMVGDGVNVEGHGDCMIVEVNATTGEFKALSPGGVYIPLAVSPATTHETPTTVQ